MSLLALFDFMPKVLPSNKLTLREELHPFNLVHMAIIISET